MKRKRDDESPVQDSLPIPPEKERDSVEGNSVHELKRDSRIQRDSLQKEAIFRAVEKRENLFITGCGGVGKSYVIATIREQLTTKGLCVAVTATTGISACPLLGCTLHHWMGLGLAKDDFLFLLSRARKVYNRGRWLKTDVLIIDEISMMNPRMLDLLDQIARIIRNRKSLPFGGMQVILVGDFGQLPPIYKTPAEKWQGLTFAFEYPKWNQYFGKTRTIHLTENFRQGDSELQKRLGVLRFAEHTKSDDEFWLKQTRPLPKEMDSLVTKLFPTNREADEVNQQKFAELCPDQKQWVTFTSISKDYEKGIGDPSMTKLFLKNMEESCLAQPEIVLAPGARVMLVANLNVEEHLVNGTCGTLVAWSEPEICKPFPVQRYPLVDFELPDGKITQQKILPHHWKLTVRNTVLAEYIQVPLKLAWALTIHKSQGMTLSKVAINLKRVFECGQGYTGLSRVKDLQGLWLTGYQSEAFRAHPAVKEFYNDLQK